MAFSRSTRFTYFAIGMALSIAAGGVSEAHVGHAADAPEAERRRRSATPEGVDSTHAVAVATGALREARQRGDSRLVGSARAALEPWISLENPPAEVLLLRATIHQHHHDFDAALDDLSRFAESRPHDPRGWLARSSILLARGEPRLARRSCDALVRTGPELVAATCIARAASVSGSAARALEVLSRALEGPKVPELPNDVRRFALASLGEIAARVGRDEYAAEAFESAMRIGRPDAQLLGAYADFLLDEGRDERARDVLVDAAPTAVGLRVRALLAELGGADSRDEPGARRIAARVARDPEFLGDLHAGEHARLVLALGDDAERAIELAKASFAHHREPRDVRTLLEAALAARRPEAARPAIDFARSTGLEGVAIQRLIEQVRELDREIRERSRPGDRPGASAASSARAAEPVRRALR